MTIVSLAPDVLHTINLGVLKSFCMTVIWACISRDVWQVGATHADARAQLSVQRLRHSLFAWYRNERHRNPDRALYELQDLTLRMLGRATKPQLSTKAAETGTLCEFCAQLVREHQDALGEQGAALAHVGTSLLEVRRILSAKRHRLDVATAQALVDAAKGAAAAREDAGIPFTPKWHLMMHLVCDVAWRGGPQVYATWFDENLNGFLGSLAKRCHRLTWHRSVLAYFKKGVTEGGAGDAASSAKKRRRQS